MTTTTTHTLDDTDRALLEALRKQLPFDHRPFKVLGRELQMSEQACLDRLGRLKSAGHLLRVCGNFDGRALGYNATAVAMQVPAPRLAEAVSLITGHPGVFRIEQRDAAFNLWSAFAVPAQDSLEHIVRILHALVQPEDTVMLPVAKRYDSLSTPDLSTAEDAAVREEDFYREDRIVAPVLGEPDRQRIRIVQEDLPLMEMPYTVWAAQADLTEENLFAWMRKMQHLALLRHFGGVVAPRAGRGSMAVVWTVAPEQVDAVGLEMARFREVSRCHRHPVYPTWPYALFTQIGTATRESCEGVIAKIQDRIGAFPHQILPTITTTSRRLRYFTPELETWWKDVGNQVDVS